MTAPTLYEHGPCRVCGVGIQRPTPPRAYDDICHECDIPSWLGDDAEQDTMLYRGHMDPDTGTITDWSD